jgi:hypothetical protein
MKIHSLFCKESNVGYEPNLTDEKRKAIDEYLKKFPEVRGGDWEEAKKMLSVYVWKHDCDEERDADGEAKNWVFLTFKVLMAILLSVIGISKTLSVMGRISKNERLVRWHKKMHVVEEMADHELSVLDAVFMTGIGVFLVSKFDCTRLLLPLSVSDMLDGALVGRWHPPVMSFIDSFFVSVAGAILVLYGVEELYKAGQSIERGSTPEGGAEPPPRDPAAQRPAERQRRRYTEPNPRGR